MPSFKGFNGWVEIFKGGKQTDSAGKEHDGDALIDKAVNSFNAAEHEPPAVIGHPKDNGPAYGWVKGLKAVAGKGGKVLLAKFDEVVPEFEELVKAGRFKKRSASFYPDGRLRHVGFLGAAPPAVKGLADLKFEEGDAVSFEFYDYNLGVMARLFGAMRDFFIEKEGVETADRIIPAWELDSLKEEANRPEEVSPANYTEPQGEEEPMADTAKQYTEADIEAAKQQGAEEAKAEAAREFAEADGKRKISEFCGRVWPGKGEAKLPPALLDAGVKEFMAGLNNQEVLEFSEGGAKQTQLAWFMDFLEGLPGAINFKEVATRDGDDLPDNENAQDIAQRAREFQDAEAKAGRTITVSQAVGHVTKGGK